MEIWISPKLGYTPQEVTGTVGKGCVGLAGGIPPEFIIHPNKHAEAC
jgi:hypothetical protein